MSSAIKVVILGIGSVFIDIPEIALKEIIMSH